LARRSDESRGRKNAADATNRRERERETEKREPRLCPLGGARRSIGGLLARLPIVDRSPLSLAAQVFSALLRIVLRAAAPVEHWFYPL
jgi:hypothetical protein